jgi:tRNA(fMet)-specific endonuclease VapC
MYCLDTNIVIAIFRGSDNSLKEKFDRLRSSGMNFAISSITLCELYRGAFLSLKREESLAQVNMFLESVNLLLQDKLSCLLFGQYYAELKKKGLLTQELDLMIGSICKANNLILITRNVKDFKNVPNLTVEKW